MNRIFNFFLKLSAKQLFAQLFAPVVLALVVWLTGYTLAAFIIFQLFIEAFVLWHLSIGANLHISKRPFYFFLFNLLFGVVYRLGTNAWQIVHYLEFKEFLQLEKILWVIPFHLYATLGVVYCFSQNAGWIIQREREKGISSSHNLMQTFFRILIFPWGLWSVQPRLNQLIGKKTVEL
jgi:hypothetical protein